MVIHVPIWQASPPQILHSSTPISVEMPQFNILKKLCCCIPPRGTFDPHGGQHTPDAVRGSVEPTPDAPIVLLNIASSISRATDLRDPLNSTSKALMKVLETANVSTSSIQLSLFRAENRIEYRVIERRLGFAPQETSIPS